MTNEPVGTSVQESLSRAIALLDAAFPGGVDLYLECFCNSDTLAGPAYLGRKLTSDFLYSVSKAAAAVEANHWREVTLNLIPSEVPQADNAVDYWVLKVTDDGMWFHGSPKAGHESVETCYVSFEPLAQALGMNPRASQVGAALPPGNFMWHEGALVFGTTDVEALCSKIAQEHLKNSSAASRSRLRP